MRPDLDNVKNLGCPGPVTAKRAGGNRPSAKKRKAGRSGAAKAAGHYHHGDLQKALVEASIQLIAEEGVSALTLRAVARRLGVSHAAPRHHFASKTELLAAVAMQGFEGLADALRQAGTGSSDPWERFEQMGIAYVRFAVEHPAHYRLMFGRELAEAPQPPMQDHWLTNPAGQLLLAVTAEAISTRKSADEEGFRTAAVAAWSLVHGLAMLWLDGPLRQMLGAAGSEEELDAIARSVVDLLVTAVAKGL